MRTAGQDEDRLTCKPAENQFARMPGNLRSRKARNPVVRHLRLGNYLTEHFGKAGAPDDGQFGPQ